MKINKYSLGVTIRTIGIGIIAVLLLLAFLNPFGGIQLLIQSSLIILLAISMIVGGQVTASVYKDEKASSAAKSTREKIYGVIGIALILAVLAIILFMAYISNRM